MTAVGKNVVIEVLDTEELVSKDGIYIPHRAIENSKLVLGRIVSVGPKCELGFKAGQTVLFDKYAINKYNDSIGALAEENIILAER